MKFALSAIGDKEAIVRETFNVYLTLSKALGRPPLAEEVAVEIIEPLQLRPQAWSGDVCKDPCAMLKLSVVEALMSVMKDLHWPKSVESVSRILKYYPDEIEVERAEHITDCCPPISFR